MPQLDNSNEDLSGALLGSMLALIGVMIKQCAGGSAVGDGAPHGFSFPKAHGNPRNQAWSFGEGGKLE